MRNVEMYWYWTAFFAICAAKSWLPFGVILFIGSIFLMISAAITIIFIPVAVVIARSATFLIWPVGARVITKNRKKVHRY